MNPLRLQDRCRGSLIGGAVGDALGYAVEFSSLDAIRNRYGEAGITEYELDSRGVAEFSDDTQMSLFTAEGLLCAAAAGKTREKEILPYITGAYRDWYFTQSRAPLKMGTSWLTHLAALWARRAPGMTCLSALETISIAGNRPVVNNSKGCGGIMRVAPIGMFSATHPDVLNLEQAGNLAGLAADITHNHPLSTFSSMVLAMIVAECMACDKIDRNRFRCIITGRVFGLLQKRFSDNRYVTRLSELVTKAMDLADGDDSDADAIRQLGEGWVAEETLAIAVFSVMRHIDDFGKCIVCSVNHSGDSDSTGAVAGNIMGAILGYRAIPGKYKRNLELHEVLVSVADDIAGTSRTEQMIARYADHLPFNVSPKFTF